MIVLSIIAALVVLIAIRLGAVDLPLDAMWRSDEPFRTILYQVRLPRVLLAALVGATLAVAGLTFQTLLRNSLADPFILGVSGGAACGAAVSTALGFARVPGAIPLIAFGGACAAAFAVMALARRHGQIDPTRLLLSGLVLNALFSALILLALSSSRGVDLTAALKWMMGTLFSATWQDVGFLAISLLVAMAVLAYLANDLRMLVFGEEDAKARGVDVERLKLVTFIVASIATGAAVAISGIIGFIGLLVPHALRMIWRADFRVLLPLTALGGAALLVAADTVARTVLAPTELPVGALTALLGVPFFIMLLRRSG